MDIFGSSRRSQSQSPPPPGIASSTSFLAPRRNSLGSNSQSGPPTFDKPFLAFPAQLSPATAEYDDPALTAKGEAEFLDAYLAVSARYPISIHRTTLAECFRGTAWPTDADPRWKRLYGAEVFQVVIWWIGANVVMERTAAASDGAFSHKYTLGEVTLRLERRLNRVLARELARFGTESPEAPRSPQNLALIWTLTIICIYLSSYLARRISARPLQKMIFASLKETGLPREASTTNLDAWLFDQLWIGTFWAAVMLEFGLAFATRTKVNFEPLDEFPSVPYLYPTIVLASIPPPSLRPPRGLIPPEFLTCAPRFDLRTSLAWIDPLHATHRDLTVSRPIVLYHCMTKLYSVGPLDLAPIVYTCLYYTTRFTSWLRDTAKLTMFDLIVAEHLVKEGAVRNKVPMLPTGTPEPAVEYLRAVFRNPHLRHAIQHRGFLRDTISTIESAKPPEFATAIRDGDFAALAPGWPSPARQDILALFALFRLVGLLIDGPEPFEEFIHHPDELSTADKEAVEETLMSLWYASPNFMEASRHE